MEPEMSRVRGWTQIRPHRELVPRFSLALLALRAQMTVTPVTTGGENLHATCNWRRYGTLACMSGRSISTK